MHGIGFLHLKFAMQSANQIQVHSASEDRGTLGGINLAQGSLGLVKMFAYFGK